MGQGEPPKTRRIKAHLPPLTADQALAKRRHRLIRAPRLRLAVANLLVLTLAALEAVADALLRLRRLRQAHVLVLQLRVLLPPFGALEVVGAHGDELLRLDLAVRHAVTEGGIGLVLEVLVEGADFCFVLAAVFRAEFGEGGGFDGYGDGEDGGWWGGGHVG